MNIPMPKYSHFLKLRSNIAKLALVPLIIWIIFFCLGNPVIAAPYASSDLNERTIEELYVYGIPGLIFVMVCVVGIGYLLQDFDDINRRNKRHNHPEDKNDSK